MNRIAYLSNPYPAISHTFIFREICSLREEGFEVFPVSVDHTPNLDKMTAAEQQEAANTMVMKSASLATLLRATATLFASSPTGFLRMARRAASFCVTGPKHPVKAVGYLAEAVLLLDFLHRHDIRHIHEHFANPTALVAMLCKEYGGVSYSLSVHGPDIFYQVDSALLADKVAGASFIRCISHYCRSQIMRITSYPHWHNAHIVRCGIDPDQYAPAEPAANPTPRLLAVGRLCPAKGQHLLLKSCALLRDQGQEFTLTLVGDGPDRASLEQLCHELNLDDRVRFCGALGQDEVRTEYRQADIFILPSFAEGVPVVLMEAMAMEKPVISTRITGIPELIEHGHTGLLATPGDVDDLTGQIRTLLADPAQGKSLGRAARQQVIAHYNQASNCSKLAHLFRQYGGMNHDR